MRLTEICAAAAALSMAPMPAHAHGGGLAADGCHNDRKNGGRHCHCAPARSAPPADGRNVCQAEDLILPTVRPRAQQGRRTFVAALPAMRYTWTGTEMA